MVIENASVRAERERLAQQFDDGVDEGYEANPNELPEWWFKLPPGRMTARQRGFFFGRELKRQEAEDEDNS